MYVKSWIIIVSTALALGGYIGGMFLFIAAFGRGPYSIVEAILLVVLVILTMGGKTFEINPPRELITVHGDIEALKEEVA